MRVASLEWSEAGGATALGLSYDVWLTKDAAQGYREIWLAALMQGGRESIGTFSSKEKAQAACQADFERRVLSCLSPHTAAGAGPVGETVVWQFEELHVGFGGRKSWHWRYSETHPGQRPDIRNVRPLYARPVEEPGEVERLRRERDEATQMVWRREVERDKELARANTAEAALAETRGLIRDAIGLVPLAHQNWHTDARTALGDAQEAGR